MADSLRRRRIVISLCGIAILLGLGFAAMKILGRRPERPPHTGNAARPIAVRTLELSRGEYREVLTGYGRSSALRNTQVSAEVAGLVKFVSPKLEAGESVEVGEVLVRLDDRDLKQAVEGAKARAAATEAGRQRLQSEYETAEKRLKWVGDEVAAARRELARLKDLARRDAATTSEIDRQSMATSLREAQYLQVEGTMSSLKAQLARNKAEAMEVEATLRKAEIDLARATIQAPYAGRVVKRSVQPGARVAPGTSLFGLVDTSRVEVAVALPGSRYRQVAVGARARVRLAADESREVACEVARIAPLVDSADRTFFVYLVLDGEQVPPGAFVVASIDGPIHKDVFVLPRTAFVGENVFVAKNGVAEMRTPQARAVLPQVMLASEGVAEGEQLIVTNLEEVADGTKVSSAPEKQAKTSGSSSGS